MLKEYYASKALARASITVVNYNVNTKLATIRMQAKPLYALMAADKGRIKVGHQATKIRETLEPRQCYHCQGYGHISINCPIKEKPEVCSKCGENHTTKECGSTHKACVNCIAAKRSDTGHRSTSNKCPIRKRQIQLLLKRIDYRGVEAPQHNNDQTPDGMDTSILEEEDDIHTAPQ